jgi:ADP-ribosylation factor GTPase-activating protein 2/3
MYFERNDYDPTTVSAAQTRLQEFKGATSISSNQYFGKPEAGDEDADQGTSYGGGAGGSGYLTAEGLQGLEVTARDALTRVVNSQEVQNLGEGLRNAGLKVRSLTLPDVGIDADSCYSYRITSPI